MISAVYIKPKLEDGVRADAVPEYIGCDVRVRKE